jgi:hypothetical protein
LRESQETTLGATRAGAIVGTITYMSPEQVRGESLDKRTDIWSFGCTLYEALTGKAPFQGKSAIDTVAAIIERDPDWSALPPGVSAETRRVLERCLEKEPQRRLGDIREARTSLATEEPTSPSRALALTLMTVTTLIVVLALAWFWWDRSRDRGQGVATSSTTGATSTVAVAALANLTGERDLDWMQEGLANLVPLRDASPLSIGKVCSSRATGSPC